MRRANATSPTRTTARLWTVSAECLEGSGAGRHFNRLKLEGHEIAINAVLGLPNGDIASASGDGTVSMLEAIKAMRTVDGFKDVLQNVAAHTGVAFNALDDDDDRRLTWDEFRALSVR